MNTIINHYLLISKLIDNYLAPVVNIVARYYVAMEFLRSGLLKLEDLFYFGFEETVDMFSNDWALPNIPPTLAAYLATVGELLLPILLIAGLFTRFAAFGLLIMALVIELFVYPNTAQHYYWMIIFALLISYGGGYLSLDRWLLKRKESMYA